jgi:hypothetical protein
MKTPLNLCPGIHGNRKNALRLHGRRDPVFAFAAKTMEEPGTLRRALLIAVAAITHQRKPKVIGM